MSENLISSELFGPLTSYGPKFLSRTTPKKQKLPKKTNIHGIKILGTGMKTGSVTVENSMLKDCGYDSDWIIQRTGIKSRCHVAPGEATSDMAIAAARECLANAGVDASEIDLIVVATMSPDHPTPSTACIVQAALGCDSALAFDVNAACSGFVYSMVMASQFVKTGCCHNALVIGSETLTVWMDREDRKTFPLFGDGAGAALISADPNEKPSNDQPSGILAYKLGSDGKLGDSLVIPGGGSRQPISHDVVDQRQQYLQMDGRTVFKWAVKMIPKIVDETLGYANVKLEDVDLFIPHQANIRIIDAAVESLGIDRGKVFVNLDKYGNTSAASIPMALHEAVMQGRVKPGSNVLMVGFGAGLTWGSCLFRW
jgi:3-oxoacyl-[acyl-carrier-protein] synthase-3